MRVYGNSHALPTRPFHQSQPSVTQIKEDRKRNERKMTRKAKYNCNRIWHYTHMAAALHNCQSTHRPGWSTRPPKAHKPRPFTPPAKPPASRPKTHPVCLCLVSQLDKEAALEHLAGRVPPQAHSVEGHASRPEVVDNRVQGGKHWTGRGTAERTQQFTARQCQQRVSSRAVLQTCRWGSVCALAMLLGQPHQLTRPCSYCHTIALSLSLTLTPERCVTTHLRRASHRVSAHQQSSVTLSGWEWHAAA